MKKNYMNRKDDSGMTLNDFLKRIDTLKDKDKMMILSDGKGWSNINIEVNENNIVISPDKIDSPFSSDR